jgi:hypothetical protein
MEMSGFVTVQKKKWLVTKIGFTEAWHWEMMKGNTMG